MLFGTVVFAQGGSDATPTMGNGRQSVGTEVAGAQTGQQGRGQGQNRQSGQGRGQQGDTSDERFTESMEQMLENIEPADLSALEIEGLMLMREEEKLARDVYFSLYETWNYPIFRNIGESEQQHMDAVKLLLDAYELDDPVGVDEPGVFASLELQGLYDSLVEEGKQSLVGALTVGATIEDLDIADLQKQIEANDNEDIGIVYQNLMKGSRNHMRSFTRLLEREEVFYAAQFITPEYLAGILATNQETEPIAESGYEF